MNQNPLPRRNLIRSAAIVPFAAVTGSAANSAVTVGLFGSGARGTYLAQLFTGNARGRLVAFCDLFDGRIENAKKKTGAESPKVYKDYHELLASDVDAVIIATAVYQHPEHFEAAVEAGKHIYIEKPAAPDVAGCKRIMRVADSADRGLNITFGFQRRYGQVYLKAKRLFDTGAISQIRMALADFVKGGVPSESQPPVQRPVTEMEQIRGWKRWRHLAGDYIVENNCHSIDVLNWFLGDHPIKAFGTGGRTVDRGGDMRDHNYVTFDYPNNVQANLRGSLLGPRSYRDVKEQFFGPGGAIETSELHWKHFRTRDDVTTEKSPRNIVTDALDEFVKRIAENRPENTAVRGAESTLSAILGMMAMDLRREVTWEEMMKSG
jgi:myo-inositol 2-dehydrogenase / D-chiro-inositol 1-dehydrogenase